MHFFHGFHHGVFALAGLGLVVVIAALFVVLNQSSNKPPSSN